MSDDGVYRTAGFTCPSCRAPLREFQQRWVCDECSSLLMPLDDFRTACADVSVGEDAHLTFHDHAPSQTKCPLCDREMQASKVTVGPVKLRGQFLTCEAHGVWLGKDLLSKSFARISSKFHRWGGGPYFDATGGHTRREFQLTTPGRDASEGLAITAWRNRPRKRTKTLTPVNAYADQKLHCPVCTSSDLVFMGDRWACAECHGLFVETAALEELVAEMVDQPWQMPAVTGAPATRSCPICAQALAVEMLEGVTIDRCQVHGVWFDPLELETVLQKSDPSSKPHGVVGWLRRLFG